MKQTCIPRSGGIFNTVIIKAADGGGAPCGLLYAGIIREKNVRESKIYSDSQTMTSENGKDWVKAQVLCPFGRNRKSGLRRISVLKIIRDRYPVYDFVS